MTALAPRARIAAVLLAAGRSRRFGGGDKMLAEVAGRPVIAWTAIAIPRDLVGDVIAVTRPEDEGRRAAIDGLGITHAVSEEPDAGQGRSIAIGISAIPSACRGALVVPGDMPGLPQDLIGKLVAAFLASGCTAIVFPTISGQQRPPVLWPREMFPSLAALQGDAGGKRLIAEHHGRACRIPLGLDRAALLADVDTLEDLDRVRVLLGAAPR